MSKRRRLALVVDSFEGEFQSALLNTTIAVAHHHDVDVVAVAGGVIDDPDDSHRNFVYKLLGRETVEGVIFASATVGHRATETQLRGVAEGFELPTVSIGAELPDFQSFLIDNERGMYELVSHLILQHHHERFAFMSGPPANQESVDRQRGLERALDEHGFDLPPELIVEGNFLRESGPRAVAMLLDKRGISPRELDALVCANDEMAIGALDELEHRGIRVPRDIALTGFDDIQYARFLRVPLTTVRQPLSHLVTTAIETVLALIVGDAPPPNEPLLPPEFVSRRSCGCLRRSRETRPSDIIIATDRPFDESVMHHFTNFRRNLDAVVRVRLDEIREDWDRKLAFALARQVEDPYDRSIFLGEAEELLSDILRSGGSVAQFQDALLNLRRLAMQAASSGEQKLAVDDAFDDTLVLASDMSAMAQAKKRYDTLQQMRAFNNVTAALLAAPDLSALSRAGADHLPNVGIHSGVISLFGSDLTQLEAHMSFDDTGPHFDTTPYAAETLVPPHILAGKIYVVEALSVPGEQLGIAAFEHGPEDGAIYERLRQTISAAVQGARLTLAVEQARQAVAKLAVTDPLTGLFNRRHFATCLERELAQSRQNKVPCSLLVVDLDGFKSINDRFGHDEGDRVLRRVANQLRGEVRDTDTVARFGGDEFVAVLPGAPQDVAIQVAERILKRMKRVRKTDTAVPILASIGVATVEPGGGIRDAKTLFRIADQALLDAKRAGKGRVHVAHFDDIRRI